MLSCTVAKRAAPSPIPTPPAPSSAASTPCNSPPSLTRPLLKLLPAIDDPIKRACTADSACHKPIGALLPSEEVLAGVGEEVEIDEGGRKEVCAAKEGAWAVRMGHHAYCDPTAWIFYGSEYDPTISNMYAEKDGCIPSSTVLTHPKFVVPWRYRNKRTGEISWKIFHLAGDKVLFELGRGQPRVLDRG
ncbi:hypothetical protein BDK51DRAFT_34188 [Blyttiomyces helicus]|uniref:Uncharacterized protein n=1 Tax=Blyttiomyces helicus TaxID=388810 RepID=A0A4P9WGF1_9FUNG|nr:hypothetical protein BDK51DRAFT_34188 [Blyttiomyces helicus]|eukprot:RKO91891.1 hypothetical protein BDK51DRAFT_34188 [Blyttiomyces helicus]